MDAMTKRAEVLPEHLAAALKISLGHLRRIAMDPSPYYRPTRPEIIKGKVREIDPPTRKLKVLLRRLHRFLQKNVPAHSSSHGGVKGKSCFSAAEMHVGKAFIVTRDIQDCYPSITTSALKNRLLALGFRRDTAWYLSQLLTHRNQIPQGSPASGDALNLFLYDGDVRVTEQCAGKGTITRSADDWVVSSGDVAFAEEAGRIVEDQIVQHGLTVNKRKRAKSGVQKSNVRQLVHNIVVNSSDGTGINAEFVANAIEAGLKYVRAARGVSPETLQLTAALREKVHGWYYYCRQARFSPAPYIRRLLRAGDRLVSTRLMKAGVTRARRWWTSDRPRELTRRWQLMLGANRSHAVEAAVRVTVGANAGATGFEDSSDPPF